MGAEQKHLRLDFCDRNNRTLKAVAFFAPDSWLRIDPDYDRVEPLVKFTENEWNGVKSCEARIVDIDFLDRRAIL